MQELGVTPQEGRRGSLELCKLLSALNPAGAFIYRGVISC